MKAPALLMFVALLFGCGDKPERAAVDAVTAKLIDPDSARFSDVSRCGKSGVFIGSVNSKNHFGGYSGKSAFVYANGVAALQSDDDASGIFVRLMADCSAAIEAETATIAAR